MEKKIIIESQVINILTQVLNEETSKVKRDEYNRVQFKLDELENSLNETCKELEKLKNSIPEGLNTLTSGRIIGIASHLSSVKKMIVQLKTKVRLHKKSAYSIQQVEEKKNKV